MIKIARIAFLHLLPLLLLLGSGCGEPATGEATATAVNLAPTRTPLAAEPTIEKPELELVWRPYTPDPEVVNLEVINNGEVAYELSVPGGDNCVEFTDSGGERRWPSHPETCDALQYIVVYPGEKVTVGEWDLEVCGDAGCLERERVAPGIYTATVTLRPAGSDWQDAAVQRTLRAALTVE